MTLLSAEHICKEFETGWIHKEKKEILHDISFTIEEGETVGLTGASGAGKSTISRIIMGLIQIQKGKLFFDGKDITNKAGKNREIQMLFQNPLASLNPRMKIIESMKEPSRIQGISVDYEKEIPKVMERFQLREELLDRRPHQLSGGEVQRICLARLLFLKPRLLILDEPTSMLDVSVQAQIIGILKEIQKEQNISYLFISHDLDLLHSCADRIGILKAGRLIEMEKTEVLYKNPKQAYTKELIAAFEDF